MAWLMLHSPGSRLSLGCTLLLLKTPVKESNRLRNCYHSDLPHIEVPITQKRAKRKATGTSAADGPPSKNICISLPIKAISPSKCKVQLC